MRTRQELTADCLECRGHGTLFDEYSVERECHYCRPSCAGCRGEWVNVEGGLCEGCIEWEAENVA